ncbi:hypothetical protein IFM89_013796 [Coptis chinensis]|uniref:EamA domain-containing protein n=1 Tax=Coptis chinensis TaxID=261450 RepID=A0A835HM48_9MAGN|nr:hypothetical protein IFM89_013796 [Coptis chinensis]
MAGMKVCKGCEPVFVMVVIDVLYAFVQLLLKKVLDEGMDHFVLIAYRTSSAAILLAPIAYFWESYGGKILPRFTDGKLRYHGDEDLGALISVVTDEDLSNIFEEFDIASQANGSPLKIRGFLYPPKIIKKISPPPSATSLKANSAAKTYLYYPHVYAPHPAPIPISFITPITSATATPTPSFEERDNKDVLSSVSRKRYEGSFTSCSQWESLAITLINERGESTNKVTNNSHVGIRKSRPNLNATILCQLFLSALVGATLTQYFFFLGIEYTSASLSCAFINIIPVLTFVMALPFRLETLDIKRATRNGEDARCNGATFWSSWYLIQAKISKTFPCQYTSTTIMNFFGTLQSVLLSFIIHRGDISIWAPKGKNDILILLYLGVVGSGIFFVGMSWCVKKKGPVFTAAFSPFIQIIVTMYEVTILHQQLYLGSILGTLVVVIGLYLLLWGKSKEAKASEAKPVEATNEEGDQDQLAV